MKTIQQITLSITYQARPPTVARIRSILYRSTVKSIVVRILFIYLMTNGLTIDYNLNMYI